jgi:hypothetical protein
LHPVAVEVANGNEIRTPSDTEIYRRPKVPIANAQQQQHVAEFRANNIHDYSP